MSNSNTPSFPDFGKMVPGFDFLQNLAKQAAGSASQSIPQLPSLGSWIAPTLNVEELDKRVQELKAVQFWLDQNAVALKATIQALEVQKMTLSTLKGMNFNMGEVANAFKLKVSDTMTSGMQRMTGKADKAEKSDRDNKFPGLEIPPSAFQADKGQNDDEAEPAARASSVQAEADRTPGPASSVADPMQWWGALTQQFQTIATEALKEVAKTAAIDATKSIASGMAKEAVKTATNMAKGMADTATKTMTGGARAAMNTALGAAWPKPAGEKEKAAPRKKATKAAVTATAKPKKAPAAKKSVAGAASTRKTSR